VSAYFRDAPNVLFDVWNEPAGGISAHSWQQSATEVVQVIRAQGAKQPIIVGGIEYSRDLSWVLGNPIRDDNIVYAAHIYPAHSRSQWDRWFGQVSKVYPVLATEWGFMDENRAEGPSHLAGDQAGYGEPFLEYLDERGIGWFTCWYDDEWQPPMFAKGWKAPTRYGAFVLERLREGP
jgi:endoglucanase